MKGQLDTQLRRVALFHKNNSWIEKNNTRNESILVRTQNKILTAEIMHQHSGWIGEKVSEQLLWRQIK